MWQKQYKLFAFVSLLTGQVKLLVSIQMDIIMSEISNNFQTTGKYVWLLKIFKAFKGFFCMQP